MAGRLTAPENAAKLRFVFFRSYIYRALKLSVSVLQFCVFRRRRHSAELSTVVIYVVNDARHSNRRSASFEQQAD